MTNAPPWLAPALAITALGVGALAFAGLIFIAQPARSAARIQAVTTKIAAAHAQANARASAPAAPITACNGDIGHIAAAYRGAMARAAAADGVTLADEQFAVRSPDEPLLSSATVSFKAHAAQDALATFLNGLAGSEPLITVRRLELQPKDGEVELNLEGAIWCAR